MQSNFLSLRFRIGFDETTCGSCLLLFLQYKNRENPTCTNSSNQVAHAKAESGQRSKNVQALRI